MNSNINPSMAILMLLPSPTAVTVSENAGSHQARRTTRRAIADMYAEDDIVPDIIF